MVDFYKVLGVEKTALAEEIKAAYRRLAKRYHPDLHPGDLEAEERFKAVNEAYGVLSDSRKRKAYDQSLASQRNKNQSDGTRPTQPIKQGASNFQGDFENFFGFRPSPKPQKKPEKNEKKNPLDASSIFEKFMGFK